MNFVSHKKIRPRWFFSYLSSVFSALSSVFCFLFSVFCTLYSVLVFPAYAASDTQTLPLTFSIEPVRAVRAEASSGGPRVELGPVVPGVDAVAQTVEVMILTNTEEPYSVYHELRNEITNGSGTLLPDEGFQYLVTPGTEGGESAVPSWMPVPPSRSLLLRSRGGPDRFVLQYTVKGKNILEAGDYYGNARITAEDG